MSNWEACVGTVRSGENMYLIQLGIDGKALPDLLDSMSVDAYNARYQTVRAAGEDADVGIMFGDGRVPDALTTGEVEAYRAYLQHPAALGNLAAGQLVIAYENPQKRTFAAEPQNQPVAS